jgi:hypothetical protein
MRLLWIGVFICAAATDVLSQDLALDAWRLEASGDGAEALEQLQRAAERAPNDPLALEAYAQFLDRHHNPAARDAYEKLNQLLARNSANPGERARIARRQVLLDLLAGDRASATRHLEQFRAAGGTGLALPDTSSTAQSQSFVEIPGPLRSFSRMAAVSPDLDLRDFMAALAHNVFLNGYSASRATESLDQTEFLKLVIRYLSQAREIEKLAGPEKILRVDTCESSLTGDLLRVLGYRMRGGCGSDVVLETVNASRAFITIDSGFPLSELEQALRTNRVFTLDYHPSRVPVLYGADYWQPRDPQKKDHPEFIDFFLSDPALCRLYFAMAALDPETADQIRKDMPAQKAKVYAHVLDFFGSMFEVRGGRAVVPGGSRSEKAWSDLVGVSPERAGVFFERLVEKDDGWLASYFDALARINGPAQDYLSEPEHLKRFYSALRGRVTSPGPARPVFRANTDLILLTARLRLDSNGKPHLPGGLDVWKNLFAGKNQAKYDPRLARAAPGWKEPEEVLEALFGLARKTADNEPLKIFMALTDLERNRVKPLDPSTVATLVTEYRTLGPQYPLFAEAPGISDATMLAFVETARHLNALKDISLRSDAVGTLQSLMSFWQIFVRQRTLPEAGADAALNAIVTSFARAQNSRDVFEAGLKGVRDLLQAAKAPVTGSVQNHVLDLLAGTRAIGASQLSDAHQRMVQEMTRVFEAQRLVSLDTILDLADRLENAAAGQKLDMTQVGRLAARIAEVQLPRSGITVRERTEMSAGYWTDRHIDTLRKLNLRSAIEKAGSDPQKLRDVRAMLAPVLRDTLVGLNYIHYAPPGAQILYTNPVFVRSHDFFGTNDRQRTWAATAVYGTGWPTNAGGRLVGSLIALPYALAEAEQNFLIPSREQALIWGDLVPQMILTAVIPRWWNVTPVQLHWVGLHMSYTEALLAESALSESSRSRLTTALSQYVPPARLKKIEALLTAGDVRAAAENVVPSEMYMVARALTPNDQASPIAAEIRRLTAEAPEAVSQTAISHAFGTPKPVLANSYQPELLSMRTFPTLMGYSSRILAESWESNLLFYAALADDMHIRPEELNVLIPAWTSQTVERIFATHLDDWPALLRSLRLVGDDVRQKAGKQMVASN